MTYQILAEIKVKDALREADKNRLIEIANRSRKTRRRQRLARLIRRIGSIRDGKCEDNSVLRQQLELDSIKKMSNENSSP